MISWDSIVIHGKLWYFIVRGICFDHLMEFDSDFMQNSIEFGCFAAMSTEMRTYEEHPKMGQSFSGLCMNKLPYLAQKY